jgi:hypothetical protein
MPKQTKKQTVKSPPTEEVDLSGPLPAFKVGDRVTIPNSPKAHTIVAVEGYRCKLSGYGPWLHVNYLSPADERVEPAPRVNPPPPGPSPAPAANGSKGGTTPPVERKRKASRPWVHESGRFFIVEIDDAGERADYFVRQRTHGVEVYQ